MTWRQLAVAAWLGSGLLHAQFGGYGGFGAPTGSMMGARGNNEPGGRLYPWASVFGSYGDTLNPAAVDAQGRPVESESYGGGLALGIGGGKNWSHTSLGLQYTASTRYYSRNGGLGSWNQIFGMGVSHSISSRTEVHTSIMGGQTFGGYGVGAGLMSFGPSLPFSGGGAFNSPFTGNLGAPTDNGIVDNEFLDARTQFAGVTAGFTTRATMQWFYGGGVGAYVVRRSGNLFESNGVSAYGNVGYAISTRTTVMAQYGYNQYSYKNLFGGNKTNSVAVGIHRVLNERAALFAFVGGANFRSQYVGTIPVDPGLGDLFGGGAATPSFEVRKVSMYSAIGTLGLSYKFKWTGVGLNYMRSVVPGNGVMLTSRRDTVSGGFSIPTGTRLATNVTLAYAHNSGIQQNLSSNTYSAQFGMGYRLFRSVHLTFGGGYRKYEFPDRLSQRSRAVSVGISFFPGDLPIVF